MGLDLYLLYRQMRRPTDLDFDPIIKELERKPIPLNHYRKKTGDGRSGALGIVNRRSLPADYSRLCWKRPYLYKLLLDFGKTFVPPEVQWNAITLNQNYRARPHYDRHNIGKSYLVAFGDYTGGDLRLHEGDLSGT